MLYIFDVDGTIAERHTVNILPGVREWFAGVDWTNTKVAFATNQGGVGLRYWMESGGFGDPSQYPTARQVMQRLSEIEQELVPPTQQLNSEIYVCFAYQSKTSGLWGPAPFAASDAEVAAFAYNDKEPQSLMLETEASWNPEWRKPAPGMLLEAIYIAGAKTSETVMVGNSDDDRAAADAAGVRFVLATEFFGGSNGSF